MAERKDSDWEKEEVEVTKPVASVVSVRVNQDLADRLFEEAQRRGVPTSALVREAVEDYFARAEATAATFDVTISSVDAPVAFYSGRSTIGRTAGSPSSVDLDRPETPLAAKK